MGGSGIDVPDAADAITVAEVKQGQLQGLLRLMWPFNLVLDSQSKETGWVLLNGPIVRPKQHEQFAALRRASYRFCGMSSYLTFPQRQTGDALDYETVCEAWCHCFREPERFLTTSIPRSLISISDFTDYQQIAPRNFRRTQSSNSFDLIYVGGMQNWQHERKNWRLAAHTIPRICAELRLKALVIGNADHEFREAPQVTYAATLPWSEFMAQLSAARLLFVPNLLDASPKVLGEALCLNVPIVVNRKILGGWKYVNSFTGAFFDDGADALSAVRRCLDSRLQPREWFRANYGPYLSGSRLLRLLGSVDPGISERRYLRLADSDETGSSGEMLTRNLGPPDIGEQ